MKISTILPAFAALLAGVAATLDKRSHGAVRHNSHRSLPQQLEGSIDLSLSSNLTKRHECDGSKGVRATYYDAGLGACGKWNSGSDFIIALSTINYGGGYPGPSCFKPITITANGKTANAVIMDQCMGCPYCGIDMSKGLFEYFVGAGRALEVGVLAVDWTFAGSSPAPAPAPAPAPVYTPPAPAPAPAPVYTPPAPAYTPPAYTPPPPAPQQKAPAQQAPAPAPAPSSSTSTPVYQPPPVVSTSSSSSSSSSVRSSSNSTLSSSTVRLNSTSSNSLNSTHSATSFNSTIASVTKSSSASSSSSTTTAGSSNGNLDDFSNMVNDMAVFVARIVTQAN